MSISGVSNLSMFTPHSSPVGAPSSVKPAASSLTETGQGTAQTSFSDRMTGALQDLGKAQAQAEKSATGYEMGTEQNLASVMVDQQVAQLGLQLAINVRNKALGAYKDIMNMPV
jgi:flagellar hook-basal body complex protein FliE